MGNQSSTHQYVHSLDWIRAMAIVAVVVVHSVRFGLVPFYPKTGGLLQLILQFGRVSFIMVTGFIIAYQYRDRSPHWLKFFKRRAQSAGIPYLIWLAIFLAFSVPLWPVLPYLQQYSQVLLTGNGHLYYLIITFQMYLLAPLLVWGLKKMQPYLTAVGIAAMLWEVGSWTMAGYLHQSSWAPALSSTTYVGYFVLGGVFGHRWQSLKQWLSRHRVWVSIAMVPLILAITGTFFFDLHWLGNLEAATSMFQPMSAIYSVGITLGLLASGTWFEEIRQNRAKLASRVTLVADASFGIYLIHPIFVHGWLTVSAKLGLPFDAMVNSALAAALGVGVSVAAVALMRQLPFSESIIGTARRVSSASTKPEEHRGRTKTSYAS